MKCRKLSIAFLLVFFLLGVDGFLQAESTMGQYRQLQQRYQTLTENLNRLVILSQKDLMTLQAQLPELIIEVQRLNQQVSQLQTEATNLIAQAEGLSLELETLKQQLTGLKTEIDKLSASLENSEKLMKLFTKQVRSLKVKTNTGLAFGIISLLLIIAKIGYDIFK